MPYFSPAAPERFTNTITISPAKISAAKAVQPLTPNEMNSEATSE